MLRARELACEKEINDLVGTVRIFRTRREALAASRCVGWGQNVIKVAFRFMSGWCVAQSMRGQLRFFVAINTAPIVLEATEKIAQKLTEDDFGRFTFALFPTYNAISTIEIFPTIENGQWIIVSKNGPRFSAKVRGRSVNDALMVWDGYRISYNNP